MPNTLNKQTSGTNAWLSLRAAADYTGCSTDTLRRRINDGQLRAYYVGRSHTVRVKASDLDALMRPIVTVGSFR